MPACGLGRFDVVVVVRCECTLTMTKQIGNGVVCCVDGDRAERRCDGFLVILFNVQFGPVGFFERAACISIWRFEFTGGSAHVQMCWCKKVAAVSAVMGIW